MPPRSQPEAPPQNDAYVGMLSISLVALIVGITLLALDYSSYPESKPSEPQAPLSLKAMQQQKGAQPAPQPQPQPMPMPMEKEKEKDKEKEKEKDKEKDKDKDKDKE